MKAKPCFKPNCRRQVDYECKCTTPETYSCTKHLEEHSKLSNKNHQLTPLFSEPIEGSREVILDFLSKEMLKRDHSRKKLINYFSQNICDLEQRTKDALKKIDKEKEKLQKYFKKISNIKKISKFSKNEVIRALSSNPDKAIAKVKNRIPECADWLSYVKEIFWKSDTIKEIASSFMKDKILSKILRINNFLESIKAVSNQNELDELKLSIQDLIEDTENIKEELESWNQKTELKIVSSNFSSSNEVTFENPKFFQNNKLSSPQISIESEKGLKKSNNIYLVDDKNLFIYNTESEREEIKAFQTEEPLDTGTCISQLPSGELFCFGVHPPASGFALIIDNNFEVRMLPSGTPCNYSSAIYFKGSIYCFGGIFVNYPIHSALSERFDFDENRWNKLKPMPQVDAYCNSIIINDDILISGWLNRNLLRYSVDSDSFTTIPYEFAAEKRKLLIKAERLHLIEYGNNGSIYECEIGSDTDWRRIAASTNSNLPWQVYISDYKGEFYIGLFEYSFFEKHKKKYYKFSLDEKALVELKNRPIKY